MEDRYAAGKHSGGKILQYEDSFRLNPWKACFYLPGQAQAPGNVMVSAIGGGHKS